MIKGPWSQLPTRDERIVSDSHQKSCQLAAEQEPEDNLDTAIILTTVRYQTLESKSTRILGAVPKAEYCETARQRM